MSKNRSHARSAARSRAFQVLYSLQFSPATTYEDVLSAFTNMPDPADTEENTSAPKPEKPYTPSGFAWDLVQGVWNHVAVLDQTIERFSQNWRVERLGRIELTLLRMAIYEILFRPDVPPKVTINEALDLSARFADARAKSFINGVLDATAKALASGSLSTASGA